MIEKCKMILVDDKTNPLSVGLAKSGAEKLSKRNGRGEINVAHLSR